LQIADSDGDRQSHGLQEARRQTGTTNSRHDQQRSANQQPSAYEERRVTVSAPIARISNVIARYGIDISRQPRWINDADAHRIARINEAASVIRIK
jgi:hypothetical protein